MSTPGLTQLLALQGYYHFRVVDGRLCCLWRYLFTIGLIHDIDEDEYKGRWCFDSEKEAISVLDSLEEIPDDRSKLPGKWRKYKGEGEDGTYHEVSFTT